MRRDPDALWRVVYVARGAARADAAADVLAREGFLARQRPIEPGAADGMIELRVLDSEAKEARDCLTEKGFY